VSAAIPRDDRLVVDEESPLVPEEVLRAPRVVDRVGFWRSAKAAEVHQALARVRAASHLVEVCLGRLLRMLRSGSGFRRWGCRNLGDYVTQELRQPSARRFRYLVAIDEAIARGPLPKLGDAWRRGRVTVSQARELIRVMTPDNEAEWLLLADALGIEGLRRRVRQELIGQGKPGAAALAWQEDGGAAWGRRLFAASRPVDAAWQVCVETSRRMAGYDMPVSDCVEDLLAEYAASCPSVLADALPMECRGSGDTQDREEPAGGQEEDGCWRRAVHVVQEAREDLAEVSKACKVARLVVDPLQGLQEGEPADPADLHRRIRWLLRIAQNVAWHETRLLKLVADLKLHRYMGIASLKQYATRMLDCSEGTLAGRLRLARRLPEFPKIEEAFRRGRITGLEASLICKVARCGTQQAWIDRACISTLQHLREDVSFCLETGEMSGLPPRRPLPDGEQPCAQPAAGRTWAGQAPPQPGDESVRVQICAPRTSAAVAVPLARRVEGWYSAFGEDPAGVVEAMLSPSGPHRPVMFHAPESTCTDWDLTLAHVRASAADGESLTESQFVALILVNFLTEWARPEIIKRSRRYRTFVRDGWRCQAPVCRSRAALHAHHIVWRSRNGPDEAWNLTCVCRAHHEMIHSGCIGVRGKAPGGIEWAMGVNADGDVRERWRNGLRVACDPLWSASGPARCTVAPDDWREACESVA